MNDIRRTILWVIFGFSMVLLWDKWQLHNGNKATFFPSTPAGTAPATSVGASGATGAASVPSSSVAASSAPGPSGVPFQQAAVAPRESVQVTTDLYRLTFDSEGGSLVRAELLQHADVGDKQGNFVLLDQSAQRVYVAQTGLVGGNYPTHKTPM